MPDSTLVGLSACGYLDLPEYFHLFLGGRGCPSRLKEQVATMGRRDFAHLQMLCQLHPFPD